MHWCRDFAQHRGDGSGAAGSGPAGHLRHRRPRHHWHPSPRKPAGSGGRESRHASSGRRIRQCSYIWKPSEVGLSVCQRCLACMQTDAGSWLSERVELPLGYHTERRELLKLAPLLGIGGALYSLQQNAKVRAQSGHVPSVTRSGVHHIQCHYTRQQHWQEAFFRVADLVLSISKGCAEGAFAGCEAGRCSTC